MELENKYYVPTIEEFYVGFEYEIRQGDNWIRESMQSNECLCDYVNSDGYRVKYLDREDIESLGWIEGSYKSMIGYVKNNKILIVSYNYKYPIIDISLLPIFKDQGPSRIFRGTIKNKSELIKLMKQLGINE